MNTATEQVSGAALLTTDTIAARLDVKPATVRGWIRLGYLDAVNIGGARKIYRVSEDQLAAFMQHSAR